MYGVVVGAIHLKLFTMLIHFVQKRVLEKLLVALDFVFAVDRKSFHVPAVLERVIFLLKHQCCDRKAEHQSSIVSGG